MRKVGSKAVLAGAVVSGIVIINQGISSGNYPLYVLGIILTWIFLWLLVVGD
jgi:hypothetical protein